MMDAQSLLVEVSASILQERQKDKVTLMSLSDEHKGAQADQRLLFVTLFLSSSMLCQLRERRKRVGQTQQNPHNSFTAYSSKTNQWSRAILQLRC